MSDSKTVHESLNPDSIEVTIRRNKQGEFEYTGFTLKAYGNFASRPETADIARKLDQGRKLVAAMLTTRPDQPDEESESGAE